MCVLTLLPDVNTFVQGGTSCTIQRTGFGGFLQIMRIFEVKVMLSLEGKRLHSVLSPRSTVLSHVSSVLTPRSLVLNSLYGIFVADVEIISTYALCG